MNLPALTLMGLCLPAALVAQETLLGNAACTTLVQQGIELVRQNKFNEALGLFDQAERADPKASGPFSGRAVAFFEASKLTTKDKVEEYRKNAEGLASAALARNPKDPLALEVARFLQGDAPSPQHTATPEAEALVGEGEALFGAHRYPEAKAKYLATFEKDPKYGAALVFAGDCDFMEKDYPQAAALFRRGVHADPFYEKGWRYLADALLAQGHEAEAREALMDGIAANPRYLPTWVTLADLPGPAWKALALKPRVRLVRGPKEGRNTVEVDQDLLADKAGGQGSGDVAIWMAYGLAQAANEAKPKPGEPMLTAFQAERAAWSQTLAIAEELAGQGKSVKDPVLRQMMAFRKAGDLEPCLFLLAFREAYRADFEAWKKANPEGVRAFLATYRIRP